MDGIYGVYFLLGALLFWGARACRRGEWNEEYTSLRQTKALQGFTALGIAFHHMAQKTCAPWHEHRFIVHGLDFFVPIGYLFVAVFLFCSGLGLYRSLKTKPDYLRSFPRRRILPVVIAYYLSEIIYLALRLAMGEKMDAATVLWYLSGLHMANVNAWYIIVIPFFYLAFYFAFKSCRREGAAILWVTLFALAYTALGAAIDHQNDWWMRGEWWYNSIILFPLGLLFGKYERQVTAFCKKTYWVMLPLFAAGMYAAWRLAGWAEGAWGYYNQGGMKVPYRLGTAGCQWLACVCFVGLWFLMMMKVRLGNGALKWLGGVTLSFYLVHGAFVELFGYNFLDMAPSAVYIRNVPLYVLAVLACSVPATLAFHWLWKGAVKLLLRKPGRADG